MSKTSNCCRFRRQRCVFPPISRDDKIAAWLPASGRDTITCGELVIVNNTRIHDLELLKILLGAALNRNLQLFMCVLQKYLMAYLPSPFKLLSAVDLSSVYPDIFSSVCSTLVFSLTSSAASAPPSCLVRHLQQGLLHLIFWSDIFSRVCSILLSGQTS